MDHSTHGTHLSSVAAMALSGFTLAALVPGVLRLTRRAPLWERMSVPPGVALPLLVLVHGWVVLADLAHPMPDGIAFASELVLLLAATLFWLPVVTYTRHRLSDPGRCICLFIAAPLLDIPALGVIAAGHSAGGIAMIVGMLPVGVTAAVVTWSWITREERQQAADGLPLAVQGGDPHAG